MGADRVLDIDIEVHGQSAQRALKSLHDTGTQAAGGIRGMFGKITPTLGDVHQLVGEATQAVKGWITAGEQSRQVDDKMIASLKAHGNATTENIAMVDQWVNATSRKLAMDDEDLKSIEAKVAALTGLSGPALNRATQATLQYAQQTGKGFEGAALAVSQFANGATQRLRGVTLEVDKNADANTRIQALLAGTAAGYAQLEAKASGLQGTQARMNITWGNIQERWGQMITTSPLVAQGMQVLAQAVDWAGAALEGNNEQANRWIAGLKTAGENVATFFKPAVDWFVSNIPLMADAWGTTVEFLKAVWDRIGPGVIAAWDQTWRNIQLVAATVWNVLTTAWEVATAVLTGVMKAATALMQDDWKGAWAAISEMGQRVWGSLRDFFKSEIGIFAKWWGDSWDALVTRVSDIWDGILSNAKSKLQPLVDFIQGIVKKIEGAWDWLADTLVWNSIVPDMNEAILKNFAQMSAGVGVIMGGMMQGVVTPAEVAARAAAQRTHNVAMPWSRGAYNARTGGYDNPFGTETYSGGNMLGQNQAVKGQVAGPLGGGRVAVSARIENIDELAQALSGRGMRLAEAQVG